MFLSNTNNVSTKDLEFDALFPYTILKSHENCMNYNNVRNRIYVFVFRFMLINNCNLSMYPC